MAERHVDHVDEAEKWLALAEKWFPKDESDALPAAQAAADIGHLHLALAAEHRSAPKPNGSCSRSAVTTGPEPRPSSGFGATGPTSSAAGSAPASSNSRNPGEVRMAEKRMEET